MSEYMDRTDNGEYLDQQWDSESDEDEDEVGPAGLKSSPERIPRLLNRGLKKSLADIMVLSLPLPRFLTWTPMSSFFSSFSFSFLSFFLAFFL